MLFILTYTFFFFFLSKNYNDTFLSVKMHKVIIHFIQYFNFPDCQAGSQKFGRFEFVKQKLFLYRNIFIIATRNYNMRRESKFRATGGMNKIISLLSD